MPLNAAVAGTVGYSSYGFAQVSVDDVARLLASFKAGAAGCREGRFLNKPLPVENIEGRPHSPSLAPARLGALASGCARAEQHHSAGHELAAP
ncbi:hypothetical protein LPJGGPFB_04304 [Ensifer adhaerens]|nr:hypothetical protein [Ensifer adhaerens]